MAATLLIVGLGAPALGQLPANGRTSVPEEVWFDSAVDHFSMSTDTTFKQRCLVEPSALPPARASAGGAAPPPVFFYAGNEGPIEEFYNNTGFVFELAARMDALVVFCEHRYYGRSLPYGAGSFTAGALGLLSIEQTLADYSLLLPRVKARYGLGEESPTIAFGGSYGGMLAAWWRLKYPAVVDGAIAASAPIPAILGAAPSPPFFQAVAEDMDRAGSACRGRVHAAFRALQTLAHGGVSGRAELGRRLGLCTAPRRAEDVDLLSLWARNAFTVLAMCNYPYASSFLAPLPPHPMRHACGLLGNGSDALEALGSVAALVYKGWTSGSPRPCLNPAEEYVPCADQTGCGLGNDATAWEYQVTCPADEGMGLERGRRQLLPSLRRCAPSSRWSLPRTASRTPSCRTSGRCPSSPPIAGTSGARSHARPGHERPSGARPVIQAAPSDRALAGSPGPTETSTLGTGEAICMPSVPPSPRSSSKGAHTILTSAAATLQTRRACALREPRRRTSSPGGLTRHAANAGAPTTTSQSAATALPSSRCNSIRRTAWGSALGDPRARRPREVAH